ncbi:glycosyl hydrolase [Kitasatospora cineracea]|uniref:glycosyl hydrolase n=1 Tax=Kitasatospora cineracea TaxID=88074 RepID=UPI0036DF1166
MKDTDFRLDGLEPADEQSAHAYDHTWVCQYQTITQHDVGERSFIVAFDPSATWDTPNTPNLVSFDVARDSERGTFSMHSSGHASFAFAQRWLIVRGCPADALAPIADVPRPADELTVRVEDRIRHSGERLAIVEHQVIDGGDVEGWSIAVDQQAKELPVRLFFESLQPEQYTYTVREGAFADWDAVDAWLEDRSTPLPEAPEYRLDAQALRTGAALSRTTSSLPQTGAVSGTPAVPVSSPQPDRGRSL